MTQFGYTAMGELGVLSSGRFTLGLGHVNFAVQPDGGLIAEFDAASGAVREEDVTALVPCGPDVGSYVKAAREWVAAGFTHLALVQVGAGSQHDFIAWAAAELLPALREL
jgi:hypothetical protein